MDNFIEQIVAKKPEKRDTIMRLLILIGFSLIAALAIVLALYIYIPIFILAIGAVYVMWFLLGNTSVEYEYIITNNEFDIDKITGKRKRKRMITFQLNTVESWGVYNDNINENVQITVSAHDCTYVNLWYMVCRHDKHGRTLLLFSPENDVLIAVNKSVPYNLRKREITQAAEKIAQEQPSTVSELFKNNENIEINKNDKKDNNEKNET